MTNDEFRSANKKSRLKLKVGQIEKSAKIFADRKSKDLLVCLNVAFVNLALFCRNGMESFANVFVSFPFYPPFSTFANFSVRVTRPRRAG
jgi:hypothetical protein